MNNIAQLSQGKRGLIELHKSACLADYNQERLSIEQYSVLIFFRIKSGKITRDKVGKLINESINPEALRSLLNKHRAVK